jgi:hypothetical protein
MPYAHTSSEYTSAVGGTPQDLQNFGIIPVRSEKQTNSAGSLVYHEATYAVKKDFSAQRFFCGGCRKLASTTTLRHHELADRTPQRWQLLFSAGWSAVLDRQIPWQSPHRTQRPRILWRP